MPHPSCSGGRLTPNHEQALYVPTITSPYSGCSHGHAALITKHVGYDAKSVEFDPGAQRRELGGVTRIPAFGVCGSVSEQRKLRAGPAPELIVAIGARRA